MRPLIFIAAAAALLQAGCTSFSGLSGNTSYSCKAPEGVACDSVAGTYANAVQNNLPSQRSRAVSRSSDGNSTQQSKAVVSERLPSAVPAEGPGTSLPPTPVTLRSAPRVLRLWFKPWEDADRDLYDQGYVYVQIDGGQWLIEHAQRQIREAYAPLRPPPRSAAPGSASASGSANEPKEAFGARPPVKGPARLPSGGDLLPGLVPPASRPDSRTDSTD